jgi:predicted restriction endonuclease
MTKRIEETIDVISEIIAHYDPSKLTAVRRLRMSAVDIVASKRAIDSKTVRDKFIRQLQPEIRTAAEFDAAFESWILTGSRKLKDSLLRHTSDSDDKRAIESLFAQRAGHEGNQDETEQTEFQNEIDERIAENSGYRDEMIKELASLSPKVAESVGYHGRRYKRDNKTVAQLKALRNYCCQVCGTTIREKNGRYYAEAAHITAKRLGGPELPENIIILCPNHHKEFDLGDTSIISYANGLLEFTMNGQTYKVTLSLR